MCCSRKYPYLVYTPTPQEISVWLYTVKLPIDDHPKCKAKEIALIAVQKVGHLQDVGPQRVLLFNCDIVLPYKEKRAHKISQCIKP